MSYNGSGTFNINSTGQPVVAGTVITASAFNALTTDLATGLTTAITKDGQTTTTARITFAQGLTSSLVTDSSSVSTGSIITDGGVGIAKNLYVGGTLNVTGSTSLTNPVINNIKMGYSTTATAAGTTTLTVASNYRQFFTGSTTQTIVLPVTSTLVTGMAYEIENNSTGTLTVNSSGGNLVGTVPAGVCAHAVCVGTTLTTAADWDWDYISTTTITGTGANVLGTSPTITTPTISSLSSAAATALTLQSAGTTAITVDTSQNVGIGVASNLTGKLSVGTVSYGQQPSVAQVNGTSLAIANNAGIFNIGSTDSSAADVGGSLGFTANGGVSGYATGQISGRRESATSSVYSSYMAFSTTASNSVIAERMRIDSSGNVMVATTSSAGKLNVAGQVTATGGIFKANGAPALSAAAAGEAMLAPDSGSGAILYGRGTTYDVAICQRSTAVALGVVTGTVNLVAPGVYSQTNPNAANVFVGTAGDLYRSTSSLKYKKNIENSVHGLIDLLNLRSVTYQSNNPDNGEQVFGGFIAEEVHNAGLTEFVQYAEDGSPDALAYGNMVALCVKSIQELKTLNDALTARIVALENA